MKKILNHTFKFTPLLAVPFYLKYGYKNENERAFAETPQKNHFEASAWMQPHRDKIKKGGEDACTKTKDDACMVIADGVGGWVKKGIDPALFSNELVRHFRTIYEQGLSSGKGPSQIGLKDTLVDAVKLTKATGTSTFVAVSLHEKEGVLYGLNLGDSGYMIVRKDSSEGKNKIIF